MLKRRLGINEPTVSLAATMLFEQGEGADERLGVNLPTLLKVGWDPSDEMSCVQTWPMVVVGMTVGLDMALFVPVVRGRPLYAFH